MVRKGRAPVSVLLADHIALFPRLLQAVIAAAMRKWGTLKAFQQHQAAMNEAEIAQRDILTGHDLKRHHS